MTGHGTSWRQDTIRTCEKMVGGGVNMELQYGGVQLTSLKTGENMSVKILSPLVCLWYRGAIYGVQYGVCVTWHETSWLRYLVYIRVEKIWGGGPGAFGTFWPRCHTYEKTSVSTPVLLPERDIVQQAQESWATQFSIKERNAACLEFYYPVYILPSRLASTRVWTASFQPLRSDPRLRQTKSTTTQQRSPAALKKGSSRRLRSPAPINIAWPCF